MPIPVLDGFIAGEKVTAAKLTNHTKTALEQAVLNKPIGMLNAGVTGQTVASSGTFSLMNIQNVVFDTDDICDPTNSKLIIRTPGIYRLTAQTCWLPPANNAAATGFRGAGIRVDINTFPSIVSMLPITSVAARLNTSVLHRLNVGSQVWLLGAQTQSGSNLTTATDFGGCFLSAEWVAA
ncbi:hypothetical protein AB0M54_45975 [Actinoplanes sp. NPDC051470]|uniref:hypothetical protein n=1 Tax=Actinoplanes sp. NPDC051470 TaxID=3157224 RepID=UPI00344A2405